MKLLKNSLIATAVCAVLSTPAIAVELDGIMTVNAKVTGRIPVLDEDGNPVINPVTGEPVLTKRAKYIEGSYFSMGSDNPNGGVSQEGGSDGGLVLGSHQNFVLDPDEPHPKGHPLAIYGAGSGFSGLPTSTSTGMAIFSFFGANTYIGTNPLSYQSANLKPPVMASVDADGNLSAELSSWEVMWNGSVFEQGPRVVAEDFDWSTVPVELWPPSAPATGFIPATGTYDYDTGDYVVAWEALIVGGPFNGVRGFWHLEGTVLANPATANAFAEPQSLNLKSQGSGFNVSLSLTDPDGNIMPASSIKEGVMISSIGSVVVPDGEITENVAGRSINGDTLTVAFDDPATGSRQDIIAAVTDAVDGSSVAVCASGKARDADGILRPFEGCNNITIRNKGNR